MRPRDEEVFMNKIYGITFIKFPKRVIFFFFFFNFARTQFFFVMEKMKLGKSATFCAFEIKLYVVSRLTCLCLFFYFIGIVVLCLFCGFALGIQCFLVVS